jgi:hypothetical protein
MGGAKLLVQTIEKATNLRISGYVEIGFGGPEGLDPIEVLGAGRKVRVRVLVDHWLVEGYMNPADRSEVARSDN